MALCLRVLRAHEKPSICILNKVIDQTHSGAESETEPAAIS